VPRKEIQPSIKNPQAIAKRIATAPNCTPAMRARAASAVNPAPMQMYHQASRRVENIAEGSLAGKCNELS